MGFAMGVERLIALLDQGGIPQQDYRPHAYLVLLGEQAQREGLLLAERLRDAVPGLRIETHCGGGSFKSQFKKADRSGAPLALILGEEECQQGRVGIKPLRDDGEQQQMSHGEAAEWLASYMQQTND